MKEIGGYFELEIGDFKNEDLEILKINNARNSLNIIITEKQIRKIYIPYYTCEVILEPILQNNIEFEFYNINKNFYPIFDFSLIKKNELFLYTNYFGICETNIEKILVQQKKLKFQLTIDNAQAFFYTPKDNENVYCFNSVRKFFGVPDGSFLYGLNSSRIKQKLDFEDSTNFVSHLIGRINANANTYYSEFLLNDKIHSSLKISKMSKLSSVILNNLNINEAKNIRNNNFKYLHDNFSSINCLNIDISNLNGPMVYPLLINSGNDLRANLIAKKVYIPKYWENEKIPLNCEIEKDFTNNIVSLPIDQRYSIEEMQYIVDIVTKYLSK